MLARRRDSRSLGKVGTARACPGQPPGVGCQQYLGLCVPSGEETVNTQTTSMGLSGADPGQKLREAKATADRW